MQLIFKWAVIPALLIVLLQTAVFASDYVKIKSEDKELEFASATIEKIERDAITFKSDDKPYKIPWKDVISFQLDPASAGRLPEFDAAYGEMGNSNFSNALKIFEQIVKLEGKGASELEVHMSIYNITFCGFQSSDKNDWKLVEKYAQLLETKFPNSYYFADALNYWGLSLEKQKKQDEAAKIYEKLTKINPALGYMRSGLLLYQKGLYNDTVTVLKKSVSSAKEQDKETAAMSNLYIAICYQSLKKWTDATTILEELTGDKGSNENYVLSLAYWRLGLCYGHNENYYKAFLSFMTAYTVFKSMLDTEQLAENLSFAILCAEKLAAKDEKWKAKAVKLNKEYESFKNYTPKTSFP